VTRWPAEGGQACDRGPAHHDGFGRRLAAEEFTLAEVNALSDPRMLVEIEGLAAQ